MRGGASDNATIRRTTYTWPRLRPDRPDRDCLLGVYLLSNTHIRMKKTTTEDWQGKLHNLHTRAKGISSEHQIDYKKLLQMVHIGRKVLDVGCGTQWLKDYLPAIAQYHGMDAYLDGPGIIREAIEETQQPAQSFDTLFVFAALDGMRDLVEATYQMKRITRQNIVILTGHGIDPDLYHTHKIDLVELNDLMQPDFSPKMHLPVHPNISLLEYFRR